MTELQTLPLELLNRILFFVDQKTLVAVCVNVCSLWKNTLQDLGFWKRYHIFWARRLRLRPIPDEVFSGGLDWTFFSRLDPKNNSFEVNLLRNCCAEDVSEEELDAQENRVDVDGLTEPWPVYPHWQILSSAGEGWIIERPLPGATCLKLPVNPSENYEKLHLCVPGCYVGSFHSCSKEQVVDLVEVGFEPEVLDCPDFIFQVTAEEWYTVTGSASFEMSITLFDQHNNVIKCINARRGYRLHRRSEYGLWQKNVILHSGSLMSCRYIHFYHGGTADGVDFGEGVDGMELLRTIKIKMTQAKLTIDYPSLIPSDNS